MERWKTNPKEHKKGEKRKYNTDTTTGAKQEGQRTPKSTSNYVLYKRAERQRLKLDFIKMTCYSEEIGLKLKTKTEKL